MFFAKVSLKRCEVAVARHFIHYKHEESERHITLRKLQLSVLIKCNYYYIAIFIVLASAMFQTLPFGRLHELTRINWFHVTPILLLPVFFPIRKYKLPPKSLLAFFAVLIGASIINIPQMGVSATALSYILDLYICIALMNLPERFDLKKLLSIGQMAAVILMVAMLFKIILYRNYLLTYPNYQEDIFHPTDMPWFFYGGSNIEASWFAIFGALVVTRPKLSSFYMAFSWLVSLIYASRAGLVACAIVTVWMIIHASSKIRFSFCVILILTVGYLSFYKLPLINSTALLSVSDTREPDVENMQLLKGSPLIRTATFYRKDENGNIIEYHLDPRLETIGKDPGSNGRIKMWKLVPEAFFERPWGYGAGNAIAALQKVSPETSFRESNVHNLIFQFLLDSGIVGAGIYLYMMLKFLIHNLKDKIVQCPYAAFVGTYMLLGMIQFQGSDVCVYLILGFYFAARSKKREISLRKQEAFL